MIFSPEQVYNILSCVVETYKLSYEYDVFQKEIGNRENSITTTFNWKFGSECSQIEQFKIKQKQLNPKRFCMTDYKFDSSKGLELKMKKEDLDEIKKTLELQFKHIIYRNQI